MTDNSLLRTRAHQGVGVLRRNETQQRREETRSCEGHDGAWSPFRPRVSNVCLSLQSLPIRKVRESKAFCRANSMSGAAPTTRTLPAQMGSATSHLARSACARRPRQTKIFLNENGHASRFLPCPRTTGSSNPMENGSLLIHAATGQGSQPGGFYGNVAHTLLQAGAHCFCHDFSPKMEPIMPKLICFTSTIASLPRRLNFDLVLGT